MTDQGMARLEGVRAAYGERAVEYTAVLGTVENLAVPDLEFVTSWAKHINGPVLDVGSGPGQWSQYFNSLGVPAAGIDPVPEFIELARTAYPDVTFEVGCAENTGQASGSFGGVFAWYSLIHTEPSEIGEALREIHRIIRPGGRLVLGFFEGSELEPFDHAITTAWYWPMEWVTAELESAGFSVDHTEVRNDPGARRHGALSALRR